MNISVRCTVNGITYRLSTWVETMRRSPNDGLMELVGKLVACVGGGDIAIQYRRDRATWQTYTEHTYLEG